MNDLSDLLQGRKKGTRILELECSCNHCVGVQLGVQLLVLHIHNFLELFKIVYLLMPTIILLSGGINIGTYLMTFH